MGSFVIANPDKCIGCRTCEIACVVEHSKDNFFYKDQNQIKFNPKLTVVKIKSLSAPIQCRQCEDAPCANVCPTKAMYREDGIIKVNSKNCIGCKSCVIACPIGAVEVSTIENEDDYDDKFYFKKNMIANKCDLCSGNDEGPQCVKVCPTNAFNIIEDKNFNVDIQNKRKKSVEFLASNK